MDAKGWLGRSGVARFLDVAIVAIVLSLLVLPGKAEPADVPDLGLARTTGAPVVDCNPEPVRCVTGGLECWAINVGYTVNEAVGGTPDYQTHDYWPTGTSYADKADAECNAARIAKAGAWREGGNPDPANRVYIPPSRLDHVRIQDLHAAAIR